MKRRLILAPIIAFGLAAAVLVGGSNAHADAPSPRHVFVDTACFSVHNPGDPVPIPITGTRFYRDQAAAHGHARAILLLHGAGEDRFSWDGGVAGPEAAPSVARQLARAGYLVIAVDRAGYGQSPYDRGPGAGFTLTPQNYVEMAHELVTQIKAGSYTTTDGGCPSGEPVEAGSASVILMGHSVGGAETMLYAGTYHDIDAAIPLAWANTGASSTLLRLFFGSVLPQVAAGNDYVTLFPPGPGAISEDCLLVNFYGPGADPDVANTQCANDNLKATPAAEFLTGPALQEQIRAVIPNVGPTPVLLVFAQFDPLFPGPDYRGPQGTDPDLVTPEIAFWQQNCGCDISTYTQHDSGHGMLWHHSTPDMTQAVIDWLQSRGLGSKSG
jgi:pimeloyl-ACP methyl ester carboxylesterase